MGAFVILEHFLSKSLPWIGIALLVFLIVFGIYGFMLYKKEDQRVSVITQKELKTLKYLLYGYFAVYVLEVFLSNSDSIDKDLLSIGIGIVLMGIACVGGFIQYRILKVK
jgi:polyferredoxin